MKSDLTVAHPRPVILKTAGHLTSDGAGVKMRRMMGGVPELRMLDPFLMLDWFGSDNPDEYMGGFPDHPHRGFETVTYMLDGKIRHRDNTGREGVIEAGDVQWMTAGRGIIHSEMPERVEGRMRGFQLWVNLPARLKMTPPHYQEIVAANIPVEERTSARIKVIAGRTAGGVEGLVQAIAAEVSYFDVDLAPNALFSEPLRSSQAAFIVVFGGDLTIAGSKLTANPVTLAVLGPGNGLMLKAGNEGARFLLIAGTPFNEPVAWHGPFVMNHDAEIMQAFEDYNRGRF